jgi:hypothetical protein
MQLFTLQNLVSHAATQTDDLANSKVVNPRPAGLTKEQFREWGVKSNTQGYFISTWEGLNPNARVGQGNPSRKLHGIIADYDSVDAKKMLNRLPSSTGHMPTWVIESFTPGKIRLIWAFEKPINVSNQQVMEGFLKELDARIKISDALPGFDKASWKDTQYFELGTNWQDVQGATPIPSSLLSLCMFEGGIKAKVQVDDSPAIPMDKIAEEVEKQFPGRWKGPFEEGARGPLFWIQDGIDRVGCAVAENGMICYSDRAASNFIPWWGIFGRKFVEEFEEKMAERYAELFYFDGERYYVKNDERWEHLNKENTILELKGAGCALKPRRGQHVSDSEKALLHIHKNRRVASAVPILFNPDEIVELKGERYLNTSTKKVMQPADDGDPSKWPFIHDFIYNGFDGQLDGIPASDYMMAWWKRAYESSYNGRPLPGQILIIAGEAHCGKTLFNTWVLGQSLGGSVNAEPILMKQTSFNKQGAEVALWRCDDAASDGDYQAKLSFAKSLKAMAANPTQLYQPKFRDAIELPFLGRVVVTTNVDPESIRVLPTMDASMKDKIMLFKIKEDFHPHFYDSNYKNEARVMQELPHALRFLLDWNPPSLVMDPKFKRFGVRAFHHPDLIQAAQTESREYVFSEILEPWITGKRNEKAGEVEVMASQLLKDLIGMSEGSAAVSRDFNVTSVGKQLGKLLQQNAVPELVGKRISAGKILWKFKFD